MSKAFNLFKGAVEVSSEPGGSQLPLAQNNPHARVTHLGKACSEPPHKEIIVDEVGCCGKGTSQGGLRGANNVLFLDAGSDYIYCSVSNYLLNCICLYGCYIS